jgi:3-oxoacyl-[acyl-carrier-protein] synthase-1
MFEDLEEGNGFSRFEKVCVASIKDALNQTAISLDNKETLFILSTTKGNIELIEESKMNEVLREQVSLDFTAQKIAAEFNAKNKALVVSNACISGVLAINIARRLLLSGKYKHVVITGADVLSRFVLSGFQALGAMSKNPCKPFDAHRDGINLGECAATVVLTADEHLAGKEKIKVLEGASTNDANHISGPSRTGAELATAVNIAMSKSGVSANDLSFISAHGTATIFNDEMEAKAFHHAELSNVPLHSLKPHFGHTLGAAGVLESIITFHSLQQKIVLPSLNFETLGTSENICVSSSLTNSNKRFALKTASGFGGCNAAVVFEVG